jgi:hypothetical protein
MYVCMYVCGCIIILNIRGLTPHFYSPLAPVTLQLLQFSHTHVARCLLIGISLFKLGFLLKTGAPCLHDFFIHYNSIKPVCLKQVAQCLVPV